MFIVVFGAYGVGYTTDTRDEGDHLNTAGASKVSNYVGTLLGTTYKLTDRRQDKAFSSWNEAYDKHKEHYLPQ